MALRYTLNYWPVPFRGHLARIVMAHVGASWEEPDFEAVVALKDAEVSEQPYPFMGPPLLYDHETGQYLSQMAAILMYLGRTHGISSRPDLELRLICDATDVLTEITRNHGAQMWDRESWEHFRKHRLSRWMQMHERLARENHLDQGETGLSQLVLCGLWHTMGLAFGPLRTDLTEQAPTVAAITTALARTPAIAGMLAGWVDCGVRYAGGEIEQSLIEMLEGGHEA